MPAQNQIQDIATSALAAADMLLANWLPDGKRKGVEYWPTNPVRGDRKPGSFSINITTGKWHDFASGDKGGDLVSLLAYLGGYRQLEAAQLIAEQLGWTGEGAPQKRDYLQEELERQRMALQRDQHQQRVDAEQQSQWKRTAVSANHKWSHNGAADPAFLYLRRKGIGPHHLRQLDQQLLVPICWRGAVVNLQTIAADGRKRFLPGGRLKGCYSPFGRVEAGSELYLVEGVATAATLYEETGKPVAAALSAGNLLPAGLELKRRYPDACLIIAGDDDRAKEAEGRPNTGKRSAIDAAAALGCQYVLPAWPEGAPLHLSDFNDLRQWQEVCA
ncbi:toprim domain-containing protein [Stutzerimonas kunmingensis]|uniref:toprim domain-containing protein n=1 Tax=Stutzerimonas kunmingensis TaxID=1211807 RepID=UPI00241EC9D1|nr:toprim domain-containing protein [Stutzerimonas kunmingensis]